MPSPRKPGPIFFGLGIIGVVIFLTLGVWQIQRLQWKTALIERVETGLKAAPTPAPGPDAWRALSDNGGEYRRVTVTGHYLSAPDTLVQAVTEQGRGFWVMTPFVAEGNWTLFINRGFIPEAKPDPGEWAAPAGTVTVDGLLRMDQPGGGFLRSNRPAEGRWFSRDLEAMSGALKIGTVAPYFIDASAGQNALPVGGLTVVKFRNSHLNYALTWFALAITLGGFLIWQMRRR